MCTTPVGAVESGIFVLGVCNIDKTLYLDILGIFLIMITKQYFALCIFMLLSWLV